MGDKRWVGIDVGGKRKGFDVAVVMNQSARYVGSFRSSDVVELAKKVVELRPEVIAIDSPQGWAADGNLSRTCEREFASMGICGIRYTPDFGKGKVGSYCEWIRNGLRLWEALATQLSRRCLIEVFPTASWTCWAGQRAPATRASWSTQALKSYDLDGELGLQRLFSNQDKRDSFVAALTAWQWSEGGAIAISGEEDAGPGSIEAGIVIPNPGSGPANWPN